MGCVQGKAQAATPALAHAAEEGSSHPLPSLLGSRAAAEQGGLSKAATSAGGAAKRLGSGTLGAVTQGAAAAGGGAKRLGSGALDAVSQGAAAAGGGAKRVGSGALGAVSQAGHGASDALRAVGRGAHEAALAARDLGRPRGRQEEADVEEVAATSWYEWLINGACGMDPWACCQPAVGGSNLLGALVKRLVETFDSAALGVEVEVGALMLDPLTGRLELDGLTVFNPEGYHSAHLLHADKVVVDIDMEKLLYSFGKELHVEELLFDGVEVIYEQGLHGSNVHALLKRLEAAPATTEVAAGAAEPASTSCTRGEAGEQDGKAAAATAASDIKLVLHAILATRVGAKLCSKLTRGHGLRLEVGSLQYADFDQEVGQGRGLMDIVRVLISTLLKSVLATVVGRDREQALVGAAHAVTGTLQVATGSLKTRFGLGALRGQA